MEFVNSPKQYHFLSIARQSPHCNDLSFYPSTIQIPNSPPTTRTRRMIQSKGRMKEITQLPMKQTMVQHRESRTVTAYCGLNILFDCTLHFGL
jgi:hypothetical protein